MKAVNVRIEGITPYLMHRFSESAEAASGKATRRVQIKSETPREAAEKTVYRDSKGSFYFPSAAILRLLREAGSAHKQKGSRKSIKFIVPAAVRIYEEGITMLNGKGPAKDYDVDSRPVTIPATKGRIMRHRARFDQWSAEFVLQINETVLEPEVIHILLQDGGQQIGIGDYRPEKGGPFGTFRVTQWEEQS